MDSPNVFWESDADLEMEIHMPWRRCFGEKIKGQVEGRLKLYAPIPRYGLSWHEGVLLRLRAKQGEPKWVNLVDGLAYVIM